MSMWCATIISPWAQPNSNLPAHNQFNIYNTHLNAWKYSDNAHEMQCMKRLKDFHKNQPKNFTITSSILKNPKTFSKTRKLRLKIMKCMNMRDLDTYQVKKNLIKAENLFEMKFGVWERSLECEKARRDWERSRKWRLNRAEQIYKCSVILDR